MPDLSILNTLIAMVIVILVLSLIVQSIQTLIKKFFKLKSRTIRNSLEDLFETVAQRPGEAAEPGEASRMVESVTGRLRKMGRETLFGRPMLDSLAKGDLLKVLTRVEARNLLPEAVGRFDAVLGVVAELKRQLGEVRAELLEGDASAKFAALRAAVLPLVNDVEALASGGRIKPEVLLGDLYRLRQLNAPEVLDILGQIQKRVGEDLDGAAKAEAAAQSALAEARKTGDPAQVAAAGGRADEARGRLEGVKAVSGALKRIAVQITALGQAFDTAFAPLRERLEQVEVWYDTVMQGFEERYTRHMRTVALVISVVVVVLLNANFFSVYRAMAADSFKTAALADRAPEILRQSREAMGDGDGAAAADGAGASQSTAPAASPTTPRAASPAPPREVTPDDLKKQGEQVNELVKTYKTFGVEPLTGRQLSNVYHGNVAAGEVFETLLGWLIMVMLLSAGAPFWQDTLESLFGLKNLLRKRSDTKNVEGQSGGQPQP